MRASNLTISIPAGKCQKNCPYCISKMTGYPEPDEGLMLQKISKVRKLAELSGVTSVLVTGKSEPFQNYQFMRNFLDAFRDFPVEIQTNGILLSKWNDYSILKDEGVDIIAFSIDKLHQLKEYSECFRKLHKADILVRICLNVTDMIMPVTYNEIIEHVRNIEAEQLLFRKIMEPSSTADTPEARKAKEWIREHTLSGSYYEKLQNDSSRNIDERWIRITANGMRIWDNNGLSVSFSDYCIQEKSNEDEIRSLIFLEDGHLYTAWNSRASILF